MGHGTSKRARTGMAFMVLMTILSLWSILFLFSSTFRLPRFPLAHAAQVFFLSAYTWPLYIPIYIPLYNVIGYLVDCKMGGNMLYLFLLSVPWRLAWQVG